MKLLRRKKQRIIQESNIIENLKKLHKSREQPMETNNADGDTEADLKERNHQLFMGSRSSRNLKSMINVGKNELKLRIFLKSLFVSFRMGKVDPKIRPLKVMFPSREIQKQFISFNR